MSGDGVLTFCGASPVRLFDEQTDVLAEMRDQFLGLGGP
jgi:hypothetical protein